MHIRKAYLFDLEKIRQFTDFWLAGRGIKHNAPGAVNDYFISPSQHKKYIEKYRTWLVFDENEIVGWTVIQKDGSMIHLLIAGDHRRQGIGKFLVQSLNPEKIHSKSNQSTGNPAGFYERLGYEKIESRQSKSRLDIDKIKPDRKKIIDIFQKTG